MAQVVRDFVPDFRRPETDAELAGAYRSALAGRRCLLLFDNAAGKEQVEPLLQPAGPLLLLTSRSRFHLPGLAARDLDELPAGDAAGLVKAIAPRLTAAEAADIAAACGRLPLALRLAGALLADRPDLTAAR